MKGDFPGGISPPGIFLSPGSDDNFWRKFRNAGSGKGGQKLHAQISMVGLVRSSQNSVTQQVGKILRVGRVRPLIHKEAPKKKK